MSLIIWLPLNEDHPYYPHLSQDREQLDDGFETLSEWIGEDSYEEPVSGKRKRRYWLQLFGRGANDRKALLCVFGTPAPPEVTLEHVEDAISYLGWDGFTWENKHRGAAWIFKTA